MLKYSCMPNIESMIKSHNEQIVYGNAKQKTSRSCNCPDKGKCLLQGNCLSKGVFYEGIVIDGNQNTGAYIGVTENDWKGRPCVHPITSEIMTNPVWSLKDKGTQI